MAGPPDGVATNGPLAGPPTGPPNGFGGPPPGVKGPGGPPGGPGGPGGPPPFNPPAEALNSMASSIAEAAKLYASATSPEEKEGALRRISMTAQKLSQSATHPRDAVFKFGFQPHVNASVRLAIGMGLFETLPPGGSITVSQIAQKTGADEQLVLRIARALGAFGVLQETGENEYAHTPMSRPYAQKPPQALFKLEWDIVTHAMSRFPQYFRKYGWKEPSDSKNTPFVFAEGEKDVEYFEMMYRDPERVQVFGDAMENATIQGNMEATRTYPFDELNAKEDEVVLVDVGGGKGQALMEIIKAHPGLKGKMVLQDLKWVVEGGTMVGPEVEVMPYDMLKAEQPVKGMSEMHLSVLSHVISVRRASTKTCSLSRTFTATSLTPPSGAKAYFFKWIFHIWTDEPCRQVLRNLRPAMGPDSRLLICDIVSTLR